MPTAEAAAYLLGPLASIEVSEPYWACLSGSLRKLRLSLKFAATPKLASGLHQLTALQELELHGCMDEWNSLSLPFPQLTSLRMSSMQIEVLELSSPRLGAAQFSDMRLGRLFGLGSSLRSLQLIYWSEPPVDLSTLFPLSNLQGLQKLEVELGVGAVNAAFLGDVPALSSLTSLLLLGAPLEAQALPVAMPASLQRWELDLRSDDAGLPEVIEALPNLQSVKLLAPERGVNLDRPLSRFVGMSALTRLEFEPGNNIEYIEWPPRALNILGQAVADLADSRSKLQLLF